MAGRDLSAEGNGLTPPIYSKSPMKRILAILLTMVALAPCASPLAKAETPQQALRAAAQRASQLHSAKLDLTRNGQMTFPSPFGAMLRQSGAPPAADAGQGQAARQLRQGRREEPAGQGRHRAGLEQRHDDGRRLVRQG